MTVLSSVFMHTAVNVIKVDHLKRTSMTNLLDPDRASLVLADNLEVVAKLTVLDDRSGILAAVCKGPKLLTSVGHGRAVCERRDVVPSDPIILVDDGAGSHRDDEDRRIIAVCRLPETTRVVRVDD